MSKKKKDDLYYLLPGMGRGARQKFYRNVTVGIIVGLLVAGLMGLFIYLANNR